MGTKWTALEALISPRPNLPEAPPSRQSLIRPWYVVWSSCSRKSHWKGADSPQHLCTSRCKSNCSCLANFGDWWGSASLWMDCLLSCNQTITCILVLFFHDDQGMSTDMFGCYQKFGPQQIRYYLIAVWVNIDVDVEAERFVFRKGRIVTVWFTLRQYAFPGVFYILCCVLCTEHYKFCTLFKIRFYATHFFKYTLHPRWKYIDASGDPLRASCDPSDFS